jgi:hypothetical protein
VRRGIAGGANHIEEGEVMAFQLDLPDLEDEIAFTDWLEVHLLAGSYVQVSRARLADGLAAKLETSAQSLEIPLGHALQEIRRRRRLAGEVYPLSVDETIIKFHATPASELYKFLLLVSIDGPMRRARRFNEIDAIFDEIVRQALISYFGSDTQALRFGWPPSNGRPNKFEKALDWLAEQVGLPVGIGKHSPGKKDGGVDIIAWKPFSDKRPSFMITYAQCTVQTDWHPKSKDIVDKVWDACIDSGRSALIALAIPFVIPKNYSKWDELKRLTNVVFDRLRITKMLAKSSLPPPDKLDEWNKREISRLAIEPI